MLSSVNECVRRRQVMSGYCERTQMLYVEKKMKRRDEESREME